CGEFSAKFAQATTAPFLQTPQILRAEPGRVPESAATAGIDVYAWPHNETSTGAVLPVRRLPDTDPGALMVVDGTSAAAGVPVDIGQTDAYYFAPQKGFAADGGLWLAFLSPDALDRAARIAASDRWIPAGLSLQTAIDNSRLDQTYNTPALATLLMLAEQIDWLLERGGLAWATARTRESADILYAWAEQRDFCAPFVENPEHRSPVVGTINFIERISAPRISQILREHGVLDVDPYRKLGQNQLRVGMFPAVEPADVAALTSCIDHLVERLD
ncbi:MAG: aminotransferase class V-fold PLP-dependent enzyme, partial [Angustibacter sp.]